MSPDAAHRRRRTVVAGHTADVAVIRAGLGDPDASVREAALGAAHRADALSLDDLVAACADPSPVVRRRAAEIGASRSDLPVEVALALLGDDSDDVVEMAAWACGEWATDDGETGHDTGHGVADAIVERLIVLAVDAAAPLVREAAVAALGAIGDPRGLDAILRGCRDKPAIRRRAVLALAPFDGPEVDAALERARHDRDWQVRQSAEDISPG